MIIGKVDFTLVATEKVHPVNTIIKIKNKENDIIIKQPSNSELINKNQNIVSYKNGKIIKSTVDGIFCRSDNSDNVGTI